MSNPFMEATLEAVLESARILEKHDLFFAEVVKEISEISKEDRTKFEANLLKRIQRLVKVENGN